MANADGGVILVGVASRRVEGLDLADSLAPMARAATLRNRLVSALSDRFGRS